MKDIQKTRQTMPAVFIIIISAVNLALGLFWGYLMGDQPFKVVHVGSFSADLLPLFEVFFALTLVGGIALLIKARKQS